MKRRVLKITAFILLIASMLVAPVSASAASKSAVMILSVTVDGARLREGPTGDYEVITSLDKGTKVFYAGKKKFAFCYVCTSHGVKGYIYKDYLAPYGAAYKNQIYYAAAKTKVYKKAGKSSGVTTLSKGQHVIVYEVQNDWAYIKTMSGKGGFVKASALRKAG